MPSCHKCVHNGKGHAKECLRCRGPAEINNHGHDKVSLDAIGNDENESACLVSASMDAEGFSGWGFQEYGERPHKHGGIHREPEDDPTIDQPDALDAARKVLYAFLDLPPKHRNLILWRVKNPGVNLGEYARRYCKTAKTKQALYKRLGDIARASPLVAVIIRGTNRIAKKGG